MVLIIISEFEHIIILPNNIIIINFKTVNEQEIRAHSDLTWFQYRAERVLCRIQRQGGLQVRPQVLENSLQPGDCCLFRLLLLAFRRPQA